MLIDNSRPVDAKGVNASLIALKRDIVRLKDELKSINVNNVTNINNNGIIANVPIGTVLMFSGINAPESFLFCDGSAVSRLTYRDLFNVIGTRYGVGDGSTTFNLPDWKDRVPQGASETHLLGEKIEAGLPNITGNAVIGAEFRINGNNSEGAISLSELGQRNDGAQYGGTKIVFNAFNGETKTDGTLKTDEEHHVYGNSDTVQMPAQTCNFIIKY